ncbi:MAG: metallophosphoesterase [Gammaproteobacteria bacterium]
MKTAFRVCLVVLVTVLAASRVAAEDGDASKVQAAYVLLAPSSTGQTVPLARVILDGADSPCPSLQSIQGKVVALAMSPRNNPDEQHFPVTVCEAVSSRGGPMRISGTGILLPALPFSVNRVTLFGDTGCKPGFQQGCNEDDGKGWPFRALADAAAASDAGPDLILHMGDYNYRGTPGKIHVNGKEERVYDAGDNTPGLDCKLTGPYVGQNSSGSDTPDTWESWRKDFFEPASKLLRAAPWVFARGNHELCSRAGPGWLYFLDTGSDLPQIGTGQRACPPAESAEPLVFRPPYRVDLNRLSILVLDSANACDQGDLHQRHFDRQFDEVATLVEQAPRMNAIWLQSHRPLWAVRAAASNTPATDRDPSGRFAFIDRTLQSAAARHRVSELIHLVVSGHMHRFQAIGFAASGEKRRPAQIVIGNGGVALADNEPENPFSFVIDGMKGAGFGLSDFGYMEIELGNSGTWKSRMLGREGAMLAECESVMKYKTGVCAPVAK